MCALYTVSSSLSQCVSVCLQCLRLHLVYFSCALSIRLSSVCSCVWLCVCITEEERAADVTQGIAICSCVFIVCFHHLLLYSHRKTVLFTVCLCICLCVCVSAMYLLMVSVCMCVCVCLYVWLSVCLSLCLSDMCYCETFQKAGWLGNVREGERDSWWATHARDTKQQRNELKTDVCDVSQWWESLTCYYSRISEEEDLGLYIELSRTLKEDFS